MKKVLIFPAGTEISFEIVNALKYSKFVELYGGTSVDDHSEFVFKNLIKGFPFIDDDKFLSFLNKVIDENEIDCIYPAHDSVSVFLSQNRELISAQCIIADEKTTMICRSKEETYRFFAYEDFIPIVYNDFSKIEDYPVFAKPKIGQGSQGAIRISNSQELELALKNNNELVICEYLPDEEYTVDCFTDRHGVLRVAKLRNRERIRAGISVRSRLIEKDESVLHIAETINSKLSFRGAWFFQLKKNAKGEYKLLEISPRIPGTMGLSRNCGINFPMLTLFDYWNYDVDILDNEYNIILDRAFYSAYKIDIQYQHIYLDYDDTLVVNGNVNTTIVRFLYQAIKQGKSIFLITKHFGDLKAELIQYRIAENLFDEIIWIKPEEEKTDYIQPEGAIFIDDSFAERKKVHDRYHIPIFDLDMVESLLDWRL